MKKVELHLHFDGSLDLSYAEKLVGHDVYDEMVSTRDGNLAEYLKKFDLPGVLLEDYDNIVEFAYRLAKVLEGEEVIYAEIRFCPFFHDKKISVDRVITGIRAGFLKVPSVKYNLIFCMMRQFEFEKNLAIINLTEKYLGNGVCGIDLAGDEAKYSTESFKDLFDIIRSKGIPCTIHAGETASYKSVEAALDFGARRIGHGIRSIDNEETVQRLVSTGVALEICADSNLDTKAVGSIQEHPIKKLVDKGVLITINTDNRTVSDTSLRHEYEMLADTFGFTKDDFLKFNLNAIEAAFITEEEKEELRKRLFE